MPRSNSAGFRAPRAGGLTFAERWRRFICDVIAAKKTSVLTRIKTDEVGEYWRAGQGPALPVIDQNCIPTVTPKVRGSA